MSMTLERLRSDVLGLPKKDRAELAEELFASLEDDPSDDETTREQLRIVRERYADFKSGIAQYVPFDEAVNEIEASLAK